MRHKGEGEELVRVERTIVDTRAIVGQRETIHWAQPCLMSRRVNILRKMPEAHM